MTKKVYCYIYDCVFFLSNIYVFFFPNLNFGECHVITFKVLFNRILTIYHYFERYYVNFKKYK